MSKFAHRLVSKNCEKLEKLQFLLKLLNSSTRKIAIFAAACKPGHKWKNLVTRYKFMFAVWPERDS